MDKLIKENERLIYKLAHRFKSSNIEDLYQVGCIGLIEAYKNYDESMGTKFSSYAYPYILGQMQNFVRQDRSVKVSRDIYYLRSTIEKARDLLAQKLMYCPSDKELADYLDIPEYQITEALNFTSVGSLDQNFGDTNIDLYDVIGNSTNVDDLIYLKDMINSLKEPERSIMIGRYLEDLTQAEVAQALGLTQTKVSREENKVLTKIKQSN